MAIKAKSPLAPWWYTPKAEEGSANPTRFRLRSLDGLEYQDIDLHRDTKTGNWRATASGVRSVLGAALLDWENMLDEQGAPLAFNVQDKGKSLSVIPAEILSELFWEVVTKSSLSEDQEKN